jgi:hypothetical protein
MERTTAENSTLAQEAGGWLIEDVDAVARGAVA